MLRDYLRQIIGYVLFIGPSEAGKTSLIWRLRTDEFKDDTTPTLSFDEQIVKNTRVIEVGGQDSCRSLWPMALTEKPSLILFVIDVTKQSDFKDYQEFVKEYPLLDDLILVGNKIDLEDRAFDNHHKKLQKLMHRVVLCSAKTGANLWTLGEVIASKSQQIRPIRTVEKEEKDKIEEGPEEKKKRQALIEKYENKF